MRVPTGPSQIQDLVKLFFGLRHEPYRKKTSLQGFRPGPTQTGLYDEMLEISVLRRRGTVLPRRNDDHGRPCTPRFLMVYHVFSWSTMSTKMVWTMTLSWYLMVDYEKHGRQSKTVVTMIIISANHGHTF